MYILQMEIRFLCYSIIMREWSQLYLLDESQRRECPFNSSFMRTEKPFDILEKKILDCSKTVPRRSNMITFWDTCDTCLHVSILINSTRENNNNKSKYRYMACWYFTLTILYINSKQIFTYVPKHTECILLFSKYLE